MAQKKSFNFEQTNARLEEIIQKLQSPSLPLEDALNLYQEGTNLLQTYQQMLDEAEQRVQVLDEQILRDFQGDEHE